MKKLYIIFLIFMTAICRANATDDGFEDWGSTDFSRAWDGQKVITDKEFEETMSKFEAKKKKQEQKRKFKGDSLKSVNEAYLSDITNMSHLISIPVTLIIGETEVPPGHYQLKAEKSRKGIDFNLYQAYSHVATIPAIETRDDFDEQEIHFAKILPQNENQLMLIYGSLDYNAYSIIKIKPMDY